MDDRVEALEARVTTLETDLKLLKSDFADLTKDVNNLANIGARIGNKTSLEDLYNSVIIFT
jgi:chaperonin cofactor prefoldin